MAELTKLTGTYIKEGSIPTTALSGGVVSSSLQIVNALPTGSVSSSAQVTALLPADVVSSSGQVTAFLPTDTVSSSAQVTAYLPTGTVSSSGQLPAGIASSSAQVIAYLPTDTVSSSGQVTAFLPTNTVSSSGQVTAFLPTNTVSSSGQVTAFLPTGTVSQSSQVNVFSTTGGDTIATTGSNTFTGVTTFSDTTNSTSYLDGAVHVAGGMSVRKDIRVSGSMTINGLLTVVSMSSQYVTSSQYNIGVSKVTVNDDDNVRFAGLSVVDSGSASPATASIFWDSLQHRFIYENLSGSSYNSAILMAGPKNTGSLGDEVGLTTGYIPYATGGDHIDNSVMFQNGSNIGIGSTVPETKLDVAGIVRSLHSTDVGTIYLGKTTGTGYVAAAIVANTSTIYNPLGRLSFRLPTHGANTDYGLTEQAFFEGTGPDSKGAIKFVLLPNGGNVGIGITNPGYLLHISGSGDVQQRIGSSGTDAGLSLISNNGGRQYVLYSGGTSSGIGVGNFAIYDATAGVARLTISGSGNIGIGTASPSQALHVYRSGADAQVLIESTVNYATTAYKNSAFTSYVGVDATGMYLDSGTSAPLRLLTAGSQRVHISSTGNVGIGAESYGKKFEVRGAALSADQVVKLYALEPSISFGFFGSGATPVTAELARVEAIDVSGNKGALLFYTQGGSATAAATERARIDANGNLGLGVTPSAWNSVYRSMQLGKGASISGRSDDNSWVELLSNAYRASSGNWTYLNNDYATAYRMSVGQHQFYTAASGSAGNTITFTQAMTLDANARLGVNTGNTSLSYRFTAAGTQNNNDIVSYNTTTGAMAYLSINDSYAQVGTQSSYSLAFITSNLVRASINADGRMSIGSSSTISDVHLVNIQGSSATHNVGIILNKTNATAQIWGITNSGPLTVYNYTLSSEALRITAANNVGIGTTNPANRLHVIGANTAARGQLTVVGDSADARISLYRDSTFHMGISAGSSDSYIGTESNAPFRLLTNGSEKVRIAAAGNVGIGITTPSMKLSLGSDVGRKFMVYDDGGGANEIGGGMGVDLGGFSAETSIFFGNYGGNGRLSIGAWTSSQTYSTKITVLANGNVGISTTNPEQLLHVYTTTANDSGGHIKYENANTGTGAATNAQIIGKSKYGTLQYMVWENYGARIGMRSTANSGAGDLYFTAGTDSAVVIMKAGGSVGIGTTNPSTFKLQVNGAVGPNADNSYDLGSSSLRWANIYTADLQLSNEGAQNDIDGTWGKWTIQEGEHNLFLINRRTNKKYKFTLEEIQ